MASLKSNTSFGEFAPASPTDCHNIYAILYKGDLYFEVVEANLSLAVVVNRFIENKVKERVRAMPGGKASKGLVDSIREDLRGKARAVQDSKGFWRLEKKGSDIRGALQVLFDTSTNYIHILSRSFSPHIKAKGREGEFQDRLMRGVVAWISAKFDVPADSMTLNSGPVPFQDYEVHEMEEFPGIYDVMRRMGLNLDFNRLPKVLLVNYGNQDMKRMVEEQLGKSTDGFISSYPFRYEEGGRELVRINPSFIVIDSYKKNIPSILRKIIWVIVRAKLAHNMAVAGDDLDEAQNALVTYLQDNIRIDMDIGKEFGNIMYASCKKDLDNDEIPTTDWMADIMARYGVDINDTKMVAFARLFLINRAMYSPETDTDVYDKMFYYAAKANNDDEIKNIQFFNQLFAVSGRIEAEGHHYDILSSYYCFPEQILKLFGYEAVGDQKIYDMKTHSLTSSPMYASERLRNPSAPNDPDYQSSSADVNDFVSGLVRRQFGDYIDNLEEVAIVRSLSSFPIVYAEAVEMFEDRGIPYRDINVALVYEPNNPGVMGGYLPASEEKPEISQLGNFNPPIIMLNIYNRALRTMDRVAEVLIHEVSHFIDDIMVSQGLADPQIMFNPQQPNSGDLNDLIRYLKQYLSESPTEFRAHAMEPYSHLKLLDAEFLQKNRVRIKGQLLREVFLSITDAEYAIREDVLRGGATITVSPSDVGDLIGEMADVVENGRDHASYYSTGNRDFDTVQVISGDASSGVLNLGSPLRYGYSVANGARIVTPPSDPIELREQREVLYSKIIDHAFNLAISNSSQD